VIRELLADLLHGVGEHVADAGSSMATMLMWIVVLIVVLTGLSLLPLIVLLGAGMGGP